MPKRSDRLAQLYAQFLAEQGEEWRARCEVVDRERRLALRQLKRREILTVAKLIDGFAGLPQRLKFAAIDLIALFEIRQAVPVLLDGLADSALRLSCADVLARLEAGAKVTRVFQKIGRRELASSQPDPNWLAAVILGLGHSHDRPSAELMLSIFERHDLPGTLRGDAGDKLGFNGVIHDRRTTLYRRCRDAALEGLFDESIDVRFWSMYVIASMCNLYDPDRKVDRTFRSALPRWREIAANDHRLAPGFWWPLSAEAEDAIGCILTGRWPDPQAAERWQENLARGSVTVESTLAELPAPRG